MQLLKIKTTTHDYVGMVHKMPKAQVWTIAKATTSCLNFIILECVMNKLRGHCQTP
jgi:hypothetical protein